MKKFLLIVFVSVLSTILFSIEHILNEQNNSIKIHLTTTDYQINSNNSFTEIAPELHFAFDDVSGAPAIPFRKYYIRVSENSEINIESEIQKFKTMELKKKIQPVPYIKSEKNIYSNIIDDDKYVTQTDLFEIGPKVLLKGNYFIPIKFYPFQYNGKFTLQIIEELNIKVSISQPVNDSRQVFYTDKISNAISNIQVYRDTVNFARFEKSDFWYKFEIHEDGMYKILKSDLSALPIDDLDPLTIRMFSTGGAAVPMTVLSDGFQFQEIPIIVSGEADGSFDEEDYIVFYARNRDGKGMNDYINDNYFYNRFSQSTTYWITFASDFSGQPKRIGFVPEVDNFDEEVSYHQKEVHYEQENIRRVDYAFWWYTNQIGGAAGDSYNFTINVETPVENLESRFYFALREEDGNSSIHSHALSINLNGTHVDNLTWNGKSYKEFNFSSITPQNGSNTLQITTQTPYMLFFDYYSFRYYQYLNYQNKQFFVTPTQLSSGENCRFTFQNDFNDEFLMYQINDFNEVFKVAPDDNNGNLSFATYYSNNEYIVLKDADYLQVDNISSYFPVDIADQNQAPVDYLIIAPDKFMSNGDEVLALHQEYQGLTGKVINQQDIFNQFNGGMPDPEAIRLFLRYYTQNISAELQAVILLGSGTNDWRNFSGSADTKNNIIYYQKNIGWSDVSDDYFTYFYTNRFPELAIGRYPAINSSEISIMINKTEQYLKNKTMGYWKNKAMIVADDNYHSTSTTDISHSSQTQTQGESLADFMYADKLFAIEYELDGYQNKPEASDEIIRRINEGRLIFYYIGHGSYKKLGDEEYFDSLTDIPALTNSDKLPLFIAASCDVALDDTQIYDSLAKKMFAYSDGGSIASIAATRKSSGYGNTQLMRTFLDYAIEDGYPIGEALAKAKEIHDTSNSSRYILFGDPLIHLNYPTPVEAITFATEFDSLQARQTVHFSGSLPQPANSELTFYVYDSEQDGSYEYALTDSTSSIFNYTKSSNYLFKGKLSVENGDFQGSFIVPDDICGGNDGKLVAYFYDETNNIDYDCYFSPIKFSGHDYSATNENPPEIEIFIDSETFQEGDIVSSSPLMIAKLSDDNGLNTLSEPGHNMIMLLDSVNEPINVTSGFIYDTNSHTSGLLTWQIEDLEEGEHELTLIVYDNFNSPSIKKVSFITKSDKKIGINDLLTYPSPYKGKGNIDFTFTLTENADIVITIYTVAGKKIRTIKEYNLATGFVQIPWNARDEDGDKIANGTYFYKVKAKDSLNGDVKEKIEKLVIYQ